MFDPARLFEIPLQGRDRKRAVQLLKYVERISARGGGAIPPQEIIPLLGFHKKVGNRIIQSRGDLRLTCPQGPKGRFDGTFFNKGRPVRETLKDIPNFKPDIIAGSRVWGRYQLKKNVLKMQQIEGLQLKNQVGNDLFEMTYRVELITLTPHSIAFF